RTGASIKPGGGQNRTCHLSYTYPIPIPLCPSTDGEGVAVFEKLPDAAVLQRERPGTAPRAFEETSEGELFVAADGAACDQVSRPHVAAVNRVMGELLLKAPVQIPGIALNNTCRGRGV